MDVRQMRLLHQESMCSVIFQEFRGLLILCAATALKSFMKSLVWMKGCAT
jgi:hypothetical protein